MADDLRVALDLIDLTEAIATSGGEVAGGLKGLGGEFGYGAVFENDVFAMHPYCWCEEDDCEYCNVCQCPSEAWSYQVDGVTVSFEVWSAAPDDSHDRSFAIDPALQCERCRTDRKAKPNFLHKPSGTAVWWYKYLGRGMEMDVRGDWETVIAECRASVKSAVESPAVWQGDAGHDLLCPSNVAHVYPATATIGGVPRPVDVTVRSGPCQCDLIARVREDASEKARLACIAVVNDASQFDGGFVMRHRVVDALRDVLL